MDWSASTTWWLAAGGLVIAELATGTFYLLMLALGCAAGALAAHAGLEVSHQVLAAALLGGGATALWHFKRMRLPSSMPAASNPDVNIDIGQTVQVTQWQPEGNARVAYRGAPWTVRLAEGHSARPGAHVIVAVQGNVLIVEPTPTV